VIKEHSFLETHPWIMAAGILLLGIGLKIILLVTNRMPFNADEAVVGLMATHILDGELPVFFWGQSYMGSLDALLVAGAFLLFGKSVLAIRIVQILLYSGTLLTTYYLGAKIIGKTEAGWMAALLVAVPTVNFTLYTTISLGGYGEALLLGNLILIIGLRVIGRNTLFDWLILGLLSGAGLWVNGLTLVYSLPVVCVCVWQLIKGNSQSPVSKPTHRLVALVAAGLLGALPWWIYGIQNGFQSLFTELLGGAIVNPEVSYFAGVGTHIVSFLLFGLTAMIGLRPPWEIRWLVMPLIPLVTAIWVLVLIWFNKYMKKVSGLGVTGSMLWGILITLASGFIFTSFGNDPSGRYFLPLWVPLSIMAGGCLCLTTRLRRWRWGVLIILVLFNLGGTVQCWINTPPGFTTQFDASTIFDHSQYDELVEFLDENSIDRGYTTYWVSYPLAFISEERLIFIPRLPYHGDFSYTARDDRYTAYDALVANSKEVGFITARQPWLDSYIRDEFRSLGIEWEEMVIGDFNVFYSLSRTVTPEEIGLID
jgi:4-amino-4-deoxy-L-arabinose transferase-like glycosyltransferase